MGVKKVAVPGSDDEAGTSPFRNPKNDARIHFVVSPRLLSSIKDRAKARGMPYTRYIRTLMERDIAAK
jgi:predicted DNA binding CopG/RHH family protein